MTARMTPTLPTMSMPQKSINFRFGERDPYSIKYHPNEPIIARVKARAN